MLTHTTLSGHMIKYSPTAAELAYLAKLTQLAGNPEVTWERMLVAAYSVENPILDPNFMPGQGSVTKAVFANQAYHVMSDLMFRKQVSLKKVDLEAVGAAHTVSVSDAAKELGIHESAVRQAIASHRLASWVKDGKHFMTPSAIKAFALTLNDSPKRASGPSPQVTIRMGNAPGQSFRVRHDGELLGKTKVQGRIVEGTLANWSKATLISGGDGDHRVFEIAPKKGASESLQFGDFFVKGEFQVVEKINNAVKAREKWAEK